MALPSLRRLSLRDLTEDNLRTLIADGESSFVEFKLQTPKSPRFGAAAASFANTLGGLVIIGVGDDREVRGWELTEGTDVQSHLGALLRAQVDPLPPFVAERRELDGKMLGLMRIFESADAPHIVRGTGAVYVRTSEGKVPVNDQRLLLELARRGESAVVRARERLASPLMTMALRNPDEYRGRETEEARVLQLVVRAAPLTVTPSFAEWPISKVAPPGRKRLRS